MEDNTVDTDLTENVVDTAHVSMLGFSKKKKSASMELCSCVNS